MRLLNFLQSDYWILKSYKKLQLEILSNWKKLKNNSDKQLLEKANQLKKRVNKQISNLDNLIVPSFSLMAESILRTKKIRLHPVQILGAIALHFGNVAEMKTGEGKTLTALLPAFLNALTGKMVCIVTVNEYLVTRDYEDNKPIFAKLGMEIGQILNSMEKTEKSANYQKSVVYTTNSEIGFDYLRDNMDSIFNPKMQRDLFYVIVDEADSVLIDEARTPLIISGRSRNRSDFYQITDNFAKGLKTTDYVIDKENKRVSLSNSGILKANKFFHVQNIYDLKNSELFHFLSNAMHANYILHKNIDYLVRGGQAKLIDHFTGRVMGDRKLSEGLHQALETKEGLKVNEETSILATITYQNFFRLFDKIAGMTGTAKTIEDEFIKTYNMHVLEIDTNLPIIRKDLKDLVFINKKDKYLHLTSKIKEFYQRGQPVLVGSSSVQTSEEISLILKHLKVPHKMLSAKHHEYEAKVIAAAGKCKSITIATNMAGRGTDIKLEPESEKLGGLVVIGAERNESERIDLQLRGRSGRQGEPGSSQFYVSLDDELFTRFGNANLKKRFAAFGGKPISSSILSRTIRKSQNRLTTLSFEQRKTLLEFDNVISQQRGVIYSQRDLLRKTSDVKLFLNKLNKHYIALLIDPIFKNTLEISQEMTLNIINQFKDRYLIIRNHRLPDDVNTWTKNELKKWIAAEMLIFWNVIQEKETKEKLQHMVKRLLVQIIDYFWTTHLDELMRVKSASFLHSYAQKRPLEKFIQESEDLFKSFKTNVVSHIVPTFYENFTRVYRDLINSGKIKSPQAVEYSAIK